MARDDTMFAAIYTSSTSTRSPVVHSKPSHICPCYHAPQSDSSGCFLCWLSRRSGSIRGAGWRFPSISLAYEPLRHVVKPVLLPVVQLQIVLRLGEQHPRLVGGGHGVEARLCSIGTAGDIIGAVNHHHCTQDIASEGCVAGGSVGSASHVATPGAAFTAHTTQTCQQDR